MTLSRSNVDWGRRDAHAGLDWRGRLVIAFREHRRLLTVQAAFLSWVTVLVTVLITDTSSPGEAPNAASRPA